jgi:putative hydrolase of the HAD superfamily
VIICHIKGLSQELFKVEIDNLKLTDGIKGYILSMIEAAMNISNNTIPIEILRKSFSTARILQKPIVLLEGVETLQALHGKYKLVVATKGDLLDQRRKTSQFRVGSFSSY